MKSMKKVLAMALTLALCASVMSFGAFAAEFTDIDNSYAKEAIERWSDTGVLGGMGNSQFNPTGTMTRAQAAQVFANLFALKSTKGALTFTDVTPDKWYADAIAKVTAAGIMNGVGNGKMNPDEPITREQFFVMFARAIGLEEQDTTSGVKSDGALWSEGYINALTDKGFVRGDGSGVNALGEISRESVATLFNQTIGTYANTAGESVEAATSAGQIVLVVADDVTVSGAIANLVVSESVDEGKVTLSDATVSGAVTVMASTDVIITGTSTVAAVAVSENAAGATITVDAGAKVETVAVAAENVSVSGTGAVASVSTASTTVNVTTKDMTGKDTFIAFAEIEEEETPLGDASSVLQPAAGGGGGGGGGGFVPTTPTPASSYTAQWADVYVDRLLSALQSAADKVGAARSKTYLSSASRSDGAITVSVNALNETLGTVWADAHGVGLRADARALKNADGNLAAYNSIQSVTIRAGNSSVTVNDSALFAAIRDGDEAAAKASAKSFMNSHKADIAGVVTGAYSAGIPSTVATAGLAILGGDADAYDTLTGLTLSDFVGTRFTVEVSNGSQTAAYTVSVN